MYYNGYSNKLLANPNNSKNPHTSVNVVIIIDEAIAGSIPTLLSINGIDDPATPAMIKFPVMAVKITRPSIGL